MSKKIDMTVYNVLFLANQKFGQKDNLTPEYCLAYKYFESFNFNDSCFSVVDSKFPNVLSLKTVKYSDDNIDCYVSKISDEEYFFYFEISSDFQNSGIRSSAFYYFPNKQRKIEVLSNPNACIYKKAKSLDFESRLFSYSKLQEMVKHIEGFNNF